MKKQLNILIISIILFCGLFISSCTEEIDLDVGSMGKKIVIYGEITTDTTKHWVRLQRTAEYLSTESTPPISGAAVEISDNLGNVVKLKESVEKRGIYETSDDYYGVPGRTYRLNVKIEGKTYTAESKLKPINPIDFIRMYYDDYYEYWGVKVWTYDNEQTDDYYLFKVRKNGIMVTDTISEWIPTDDSFFNGRYSNGIICQDFDEEKEDEQINVGDVITFESNGVTEDYYNYVKDVQTEISFSGPTFSGPPANISTNLTGGALGFFTAYSISRASYVVQKGDKEWNGELD